MEYLGKHILAEFFGCSPDKLANLEFIKEIMIEAANRANSTILGDLFHPFQPGGISGVLLIKESHVSIHTWPEYGYAAVDLFTCGERVNPWTAFDILNEKLEAKRKILLEVKRGVSLKQGREKCP